MSDLTVRVIGDPAPQGSKTAYRKGNRTVLVESSKAVKPWRAIVAAETVQAKRQQQQPMLIGDVEVGLVFWLRRPAGHYGTGRNAGSLRPSAPPRPGVKPDLDKLARSTLDALGTANAYSDDSRVVLLQAEKRYATEEHPPGVHITIKEV